MKKKPPITQEEIDLFKQAVEDVNPRSQTSHDAPLDESTEMASIPASDQTLFSQVFEQIPAHSPQTEDNNRLDNLPWPQDSTTVPTYNTDTLAVADVSGNESLYFCRPGVQHQVIKKLKRGQLKPQQEIDLHGLTINEAHERIVDFLSTCHSQQTRTVRIIHGKSHGKLGQKPIIKNFVNQYLREREDILAFCSAPAKDGGTGAVYVLLKSF